MNPDIEFSHRGIQTSRRGLAAPPIAIRVRAPSAALDNAFNLQI
ncbi:hypothetical protein RSSM_00945 [Rhodopirellula sallentina SM41]|uniref:Uncharacterized protein n=1 Tax=Rhodopirellula sallentina SM41 TaxID=1263870 RepID=M5U8J1_9BACT|nr:hypothetical protein RSSM_00945 [Rhodopirellula sallentina SM41]